jgi:phosphonate transport system substrate-binding protein
MKGLKNKPLEIDFNDIVDDTGKPSKKTPCPQLKIAVAAMISPQDTYKYYAQLLNLIGDRMNRRVSFIQKKTYAEVNEMLKRKELDLAFVCSGPYVSGKKEFDLEILAVPVCHGKKVYHSYFIASKESSIRSFVDLRGKTFAFTDSLSNTGYMVPVFFLAKQDQTPEQYFKKTFFTHSHDNSIQAVANGLAEGAAVDSLIYDFMQKTDPDLTGKTRIIGKSSPFGIPPVVTISSLDPKIKAQLKQIFFSIHNDPEGKVILYKLQIDRFVEGNDADYDTVRQLQKFLKPKLE